MLQKRYPANPITPHGWHMLVDGEHPAVWLDSHDNTVRFDLMGGLAVADPAQAPECVLIDRDGLRGLIPPWRHIDQKGSAEDGVTQLDALYEPIEVELNVTAVGRDAKHLRQVVRDFYASLDAKQESRLNFFTPDAGHWWANVRWFKGAQPSPVAGGHRKFQRLSMRLRADRGFWRSYEHTSVFDFQFDKIVDEFDTDYSSGAGDDWPLWFIGDGSGGPYVAGGQLRWDEDGTDERACVLGPYKDFDTDTDNQVVQIQLGSIPQINIRGGAFVDIWARMGRDGNGDWSGDGVRCRIGLRGVLGWIELSKFKNFTKTVMKERVMLVPPFWFENYTLVAGFDGDGNERQFRVLRNGLPILTHRETGTDLSHMGDGYRGVGLGMQAGAGIITQASPPSVRRFAAGDNVEVTQNGWLRLVNIGDQPMYYDYICFGPGTFRIWDGPGAGAEDYVEFGPLTPGQVALLRSDPRDRNVYDLTVIPEQPATESDRSLLRMLRSAFESLLSLAYQNPILGAVQSVLGIFGGRTATPPSGNLYALLKGRFSDRAAIPPKSPGRDAEPHHVKVGILKGDADSRVIASGIPLRRYPL